MRKDIEAYINAVNSGRREVSAIQRRNGNLAMSAVVPSGEYGVGVADSMTSVFLEDAGYHVRGAEKAELEMAGNETESFQVVVAGMKKELKEVLKKMLVALKPGGWIYTSFKYGEYEGERNGRYFTDFTIDTFADFVQEIHNLQIKEHWITGDVRPGRGEEKWLNLIMQKK